MWGIFEDFSRLGTKVRRTKCLSCKFTIIYKIHAYSFFSASAGLVLAARRVCQRTAMMAIKKDRAIADAYIQNVLPTFTTEFNDKRLNSKYMSGMAMMSAISTIFMYALMFLTVSVSIVPPKIFLMAISCLLSDAK